MLLNEIPVFFMFFRANVFQAQLFKSRTSANKNVKKMTGVNKI